MGHFPPVVFAIAFGALVVALTAVARRLPVPTPILQVVAGYFKVGQLFRSIAPAVVFGMLAGIGVLIFAAQFHVMVDDAPRENGIRNLLAIPEAVYKGLRPSAETVHHLAAMIGVFIALMPRPAGRTATSMLYTSI